MWGAHKQEPKSILIAGGGFAGLAAARELSCAGFGVVVVDPKSYFEHVPLAPYSIVTPASATRALVDYPLTGPVQHKQGLVVALSSDGTKGQATLQDGDTISFDYCLLATGSSYPSAIKPGVDSLHHRADRLRQLFDIGTKLKAAATVVVVGGGAVGVELAAEVADAYPDKKVTLVSSGGLLDRLAPQAVDYATSWLREHNVEVLTGERISDWGALGDGPPTAATLKTASGRTLQADLAFKCVGHKPATAAYAASLGASRLAGNGAVEVEPTLQVKGWANVFSAGDCNAVELEKTAAMAGLSALAVAANIIALDQGRKLATFPEDFFGSLQPPMAGGASLGRSVGLMQLGTDVQTGTGPAKIKGALSWVYVRAVAGSWLWGFAYRKLQVLVVMAMKKEARKAAAATIAAPASAPAAITA